MSRLALMLCIWLAAVPPPKPGRPASQPRDRDADLAKRLLGDPAAGDDAIARMMALMAEAGERLSEKSDSGPQTQTAQSDALKALDEAIADARRNMSKSSSSSSKKQKGEARTAGKRDTSRQQSKSAKSGDPSNKPVNSGEGPGGGAKKDRPLAERPELRRGWGYLPQRDREAIIQGAGEEFHDKYREFIEQYYRRIAEEAEKRP